MVALALLLCGASAVAFANQELAGTGEQQALAQPPLPV
jgi:hypothetical protein